MLAFISDTGIVVAVIAFVALFGASQIPKLARNLGEAGREFRKAHTELTASPSETPAPTTPTLPAPTLATPTLATPTLATPTLATPTLATPTLATPTLATPTLVAATSSDGRITLSKAQFDALVADRPAPVETRS